MSGTSVHANHLPAIAIDEKGDRQGASRFDYGLLPQEKALALCECRTRIRAEMMKTTASVIAIGRELIAVKKTLRHGAFGPWVESECGFSLRSAQNYMRVARLADKNATVAHLPLATSYRMTGRRSSRWMLTAASERAADAEEMTEAGIERLYKAFRKPKARRAERKSRVLARNATSKSGQNPQAEFAGQSCRADFADKHSRAQFAENPSPAEAEQSAEWILDKCGEGPAISLVLMYAAGTLDETMRVLRRKLYAIKEKREKNEFSTSGNMSRESC